MPKRDPVAPKRARGPYIYFCMERRPHLSGSMIEKAKLMGKEWAALKDKSKYGSLAHEDKARYQTEQAAYVASGAKKRWMQRTKLAKFSRDSARKRKRLGRSGAALVTDALRQAAQDWRRGLYRRLDVTVGKPVRVLTNGQWLPATVTKCSPSSATVEVRVDGRLIGIVAETFLNRLCPCEAYVVDERDQTVHGLGVEATLPVLRTMMVAVGLPATATYYVAANNQTYTVLCPAGAGVQTALIQKNRTTGVEHKLSFRPWGISKKVTLEEALTPLVPAEYEPCTDAFTLAELEEHLGKAPVFVFQAKADPLPREVLKRKRADYEAKGIPTKIQKCYHGSKVENAKALGTWGGLKDRSGSANGMVHGRGFNVTTVADATKTTAALSLDSFYAPTTTLDGGHVVTMVVQYDGLVGTKTYRSYSSSNEPSAGFVTMGNNCETMDRLNGKKTDIRVFPPSVMNTHLVPTTIAFFE